MILFSFLRKSSEIRFPAGRPSSNIETSNEWRLIFNIVTFKKKVSVRKLNQIVDGLLVIDYYIIMAFCYGNNNISEQWMLRALLL